MNGGADAIAEVGEGLQRPAIHCLYGGTGFGVAQQDLFDPLLRHPVGQLGGAPIAPHRFDLHRGLGSGRQFDARKFMRCIAGEVGDIGRVVWRQAERANLVCKAQATEMFHGARLGRIGLRIKGCGGLAVDQHATNASPAQFDRQRQAARPATHDENIGVDR